MMDTVLLQPSKATNSSRTPTEWIRSQFLTPQYWTFFAVAFFFDAGFAIYFFLFNLFLLDAHAAERTIGLINGAFTLGSTLTILPAGLMGRRWGVKPLLLTCMVAAPALGVLRVFYLGMPAQIALGFLAGAAMSLWGIAYLPAVARLTTDENRASAYSLIFSASIFTSAIGGAVTGYLPRWLNHSQATVAMFEVHRSILLSACVIAAIAIWPSSRLHLASSERADEQNVTLLAGFRPTPFLLRCLPFMALWTASMGAFLPFANVYLAREHHISMQSIALIFSVAQCLQLLLGLLTPVVLRIFGLMQGILLIQLTAATCLGGLALLHFGPATVVLYLCFTTVQWMCSPALYNLLMSSTDDAQRSQAAAMAMFLNTLLSALTVALAGVAFSLYGYRVPLIFIACAGGLSALATFKFVRPQVRQDLQ
jgi:MFS family permease